MPEDDLDYYRERQRQEMRAADRATDICCRKVHLELARRYGIRVIETSAVLVISLETSGSVQPISVQQSSFQSTVLDGFETEVL